MILEDDTPKLELESLVDTDVPTTSVPPGSVRNRAATTAILSSEPDQLVEKYRLLMQEGAEGKTITHEMAMQELDAREKTKNMRHVINILGDKSIPLEQKKRLMDVVQRGEMKPEPSAILQANALEAPNKGETVKGEMARLTMADALDEIHQEAQDRQRLMNGLMATLPEAGVGTVADIAGAEVMPFGRNVINAKIAAKLDELEGKDTSIGQWVKNFLLPGSTKNDIRRRLNAIPVKQRNEFTAKLLQSIKESASIFPSDNYYAQYTSAVQLLEQGQVSGTEEWTENALTVLDAFWVGGEFSALRKGKAVPSAAQEKQFKGKGSKKTTQEEVVHKADWELVEDVYPPSAQIASNVKKLTNTAEQLKLNSVIRRENPVTPLSIVEQVNPASAREMMEAIVRAEGDELAEALTGVNKEQAIANHISPQIAVDDTVLFKAGLDNEFQAAVSNASTIRYTDQELASATSVIKNDFRHATGLQINDAMTTFRVDGDFMVIDGHYTAPGGAFTTPQAAKEQAAFALRRYGIREDEITIMKREGMSYVPVTGGEGAGDYIVKVRTKQPITDSDVGNWSDLDVKRNWLDRVSWMGSDTTGTWSNNLFDFNSMLHPTLTSSMNVATDQAVSLENYLLKPIREFRSTIEGFAKDRQMLINDYLVEANNKGIAFDRFNLRAKGFTEKEVDAIEGWKNIWDRQFYLENNDLVKTLRSQKYELFNTGGTQLVAKPVAKNQNIIRLYDPAENKVVTFTKDQMDELYENGGTFAAFRRPITVEGMNVEHMIVRNTPTEHLRRIRDTDMLLNYRHGYYTKTYKKGAKFVDEIAEDGSRRTVAVAGSTKDADLFAKAQAEETGLVYQVREDVRGFTKDGNDYWDVHSAGGRIAQRLRGQPLVEATGMNELGTSMFVDNPMESAARAARSIAGRTLGRSAIETAKRRFIEMYGDLLPSNGMGGVNFPTSRSQIVDHRSHVSKRAADARTTWHYIDYMENGYINGIDEKFKGWMQAVANIFGEKHMSGLEKFFNAASDYTPTTMAKGTVFQAYIATGNFIRQWIVQSHQASRTAAYNPVGWLNGGVGKRFAGFIHAKVGGTVGKDLQAFVKFVDESGMVAGVDRNSLVRGIKLNLADSTNKAKRVAGNVAAVPQTLGFDLGEKGNQLGHLAAVHEKYVREGMDLSNKLVRDRAYAEARALSYEMNKPGDLAYTQTTPAFLLQFLQMPHKAFLQMTNRKLPVATRMRLAGWDLLAYGAAGTGVSAIVDALYDDALPEDQEMRDAYLYGIEAWGLNRMISMMDDSGDNTRIDFGVLAPYGMDGWAKMYNAFMEDGMFAALAASPSGQLFAVNGVNDSKRNGRIPQAMITLGRWFNVFDELDPENPTTFNAVLNDVAKISSSWSSASNARVLMNIRQKIDSMGGVVDEYITIPESYSAILGLGTLDTKELYEVSRNRARDKKKYEEEVMSRYRDIAAYVTAETEKPGADIQHIQRVQSMLMRSFTPEEFAMVRQQWMKDMQGPYIGTTRQIMKASGLPDQEQFKNDVKRMPDMDDRVKQMMLERVQHLNDYREKE